MKKTKQLFMNLKTMNAVDVRQLSKHLYKNYYDLYIYSKWAEL